MENFDLFIQDLKELVAINSEKTKASTSAPFGEGNLLALQKFLEIATRLGFNPVNHQNYIAEFSVGDGEEVGIIGHLDVVPAGDNWLTPPFTLTEKEGVYYGRGVSDDKGPTLLALYALKAVVDSGINFKRKIRFFVGTNEESGWADIDYFIKNGGVFPEYGFSPDGEFPLSYAEKGIYPTEFTIDGFENFHFINGGTALNQVCDYATVKPKFIPDQKELNMFNLTFDGKLIISKGVAAHGSTPQKGKNAFKPILEYMLFKGEKVKEVLECLFLDREGIFQMQNEQGEITLSPNLACEKEGVQTFTCDVRIPYPFTIGDLEQKYKKFGFPYKVIEEKHPPMCVNKDGWFVNSLLSAYNDATGEDRKPISMGGSTYARAFKMGCAFGASFPNFDNGEHKPNEKVTKEHLIKAFEIYKKAIENLVK